ncbi:CBF/Mak21 family-domain-containing protein [Parasitella parasitica]|nr:CBF/Mak21 family-domain-containing protein [Parasitella parasitica]
MAPQAKRKREGNNSTENFKEIRQKIRTLEAGLSNKSNLNNIVEITKYSKSSNAQIAHAAIHSLNRVYTAFLMAGDLKKLKNADESSAKAKVNAWLCEQYADYLAHVRGLLSSDEPGLQIPAFTILMNNIKSESENFINTSGSYHFANNVYGPIVKEILFNTNFNEHLRKEVVDKYLNVYDDLRHYFLKDAAEVMEQAYEKREAAKKQKSSKKAKLSVEEKKEDHSLVANNVFAILESIRTMPTEASEIDEFWTVNPSIYDALTPSKSKKTDDLLGDEGLLSDSDVDDNEQEAADKTKTKKRKHPLLQLSVHKRGFTDCWLRLMKLRLSEDMYKKILLILHKRILPHLSEPKLLMDFLTDSYNVGGAVSLLALNGLFTLITEHNLDYPDFYTKLYSILDRNVMHVKYRSRFFRLLELFLSSAYLPAALIAAFIKRMARLSLTAPPAASVIIIPFIYNLLKRHPTCMTLIHSNKAIDDATDPFSMENLNPYECKAIESSLWEVQTLSQHYYANVSTLAKIFGEQFLKPKYNLEDFLDHTYATFFSTEIDRKRKKEPALAIDKPLACVWEI